ncbi:MAG: hypothetical protein IK101_08340 [Oscillospiraceae bacterium]|nr:hypothetical protein [Oscillospiraceae bacterium]
MSGRRSTLLAVAVTVGITALAIAAILIFGDSNKPTDIVLPDEPPAAAVSPDQTAPEEKTGLVEVTRETVQAVVRTLERPEAYSRRLGVESFWDSGSALYSAEAWVRSGSVRLTVSGVETKNVLVTENKVYIWYDTEDVFEAPRDPGESLIRSADAFNMLVTYEDVLDLPTRDITDARYDEYGGERCIFVTALSGGYETQYVVSVATGLLVHAERRDGEGKLVYVMEASEPVLSAPSEDVFELPSAE